jgi:superfamily II DNA helicase RecQ
VGLFLGVKAYNKDMQARDNNIALQNCFMDGSIKLMFATAAFGCGVDVKCVRAVYHFGHTWSILDYAQECGRAGRDGALAECTMFLSDDSMAPSADSEVGVKELNDLIQPGVCRRMVMNDFFDGAGWSCYVENDIQLCDTCESVLEQEGSKSCTVQERAKGPERVGMLLLASDWFRI